jgi:hypothetical protein
MQCNIGTIGRRVRVFSGLTFCVVALILATIGFLRAGIISWIGIIAAAILAIGIFQIFEGVIGWCAVRALGIKTKY